MRHEACSTLGLGLHPWFVEAAHEGWLVDLEKLLLARTQAVVGEIGLDRIRAHASSPAYVAQLGAFRVQLRLAARLGRPVSIHCVRAYGDLVNELRMLSTSRTVGSTSGVGDSLRQNRDSSVDGSLPPAVAIHSYAGSPETAVELLALPSGLGRQIYFGLSTHFSCRNPSKLASLLQCLPHDRLLLESDAHDEQVGARRMEAVCTAVADAKGWSLEETAQLTSRNAQAFLGSCCGPPSKHNCVFTSLFEGESHAQMEKCEGLVV